MPLPDKLNIEITYCVPCSYHGIAAWLVSEFFAEGGNRVAVALNPGEAGVLTIEVEGEKVYDKKAEDGKFPDVTRVKELRADIRQRLAS